MIRELKKYYFSKLLISRLCNKSLTIAMPLVFLKRIHVVPIYLIWITIAAILLLIGVHSLTSLLDAPRYNRNRRNMYHFSGVLFFIEMQPYYKKNPLPISFGLIFDDAMCIHSQLKLNYDLHSWTRQIW